MKNWKNNQRQQENGNKIGMNLKKMVRRLQKKGPKVVGKSEKWLKRTVTGSKKKCQKFVFVPKVMSMSISYNVFI